MGTEIRELNPDQLGSGSSAGCVIMDKSDNKAYILGSDKSVDGIVGIQAVTGRLYYQESQFGDTGIQGGTGIIGLQGRTGIQGDTGVQGIQGSQGDTGVQGVGIQGLQGDTGVQGIQGSQGDTGIQGVGTQGDTGIKGDLGLTGVTGIQGLQGSTTDPWSIVATLGSIAGWDSTGGIYIVDSAGHTGVLAYYFNA